MAHIPPADMDQNKSVARFWAVDARLQPQTRVASRRLVDRDWTEAARTRHPAAAIDSFWDLARNVWPRDAKLGDAGLRIAHILRSPDLTAWIDDGGIDRDGRGHANANDQANASDHVAPWVTLLCAGRPERRRVRSQRRAAEP